MSGDMQHVRIQECPRSTQNSARASSQLGASEAPTLIHSESSCGALHGAVDHTPQRGGFAVQLLLRLLLVGCPSHCRQEHEETLQRNILALLQLDRYRSLRSALVWPALTSLPEKQNLLQNVHLSPLHTGLTADQNTEPDNCKRH